jgi:predicted GNAT family acetyltransferase
MTDVVNNRAQHRYELAVDGHSPRPITSSAATSSPLSIPRCHPELGGKSIGAKLIKGALDQVRADGLKVVAQYPLVKAYIMTLAAIVIRSDHRTRQTSAAL